MGCNERFLQYTFSGTKEKWANAASDKFTTSQQVSSQETFQNGHKGKGATVSRKRRLVNNSRSVRCIFPSEDFQASSKISQIQFSGQSLPISSAKFWPNGSTQNFYEIDVSSSSSLEKTKHTSCNIPRRLANFKSDKKNVMARSIYCPPSPFPVRFHNKQTEVKSGSQSESDIYRRPFSVRKRPSFSDSRTSSRAESSSPSASSGSEHCIPLSGSVGKDSILSGTDSKCQTIHETNPAASVTKLEPSKNDYVLSNYCYTVAQATFAMVVTGSKYFTGSICSTDTVYRNCDNRCKSEIRLGWSHEQSYSARPLVESAKASAHQLSGNEGSISDNEIFSAEPF